MDYGRFVEAARLIRSSDVETVGTSGNLDYEGKVIEVWAGEDELLHFVRGKGEELQLLVIGSASEWRIGLVDLESLVRQAREALDT